MSRNILILNGAGKKNGKTKALIDAFSKGATEAGHQVTEFYLQTMNIHGCIDCQDCARKPSGDPRPCVQNDDMNQIYDVFKDADLVVFASPVYWFSISGTLKTAVDRLYAFENNLGFGNVKKETVLLLTSGAPAEQNPVSIAWYDMFEKMGWPSLGKLLGQDKTDQAYALGRSI